MPATVLGIGDDPMYKTWLVHLRKSKLSSFYPYPVLPAFLLGQDPFLGPSRLYHQLNHICL